MERSKRLLGGTYQWRQYLVVKAGKDICIDDHYARGCLDHHK